MKSSKRTIEATVAQKYSSLDTLEPSQLKNLVETIAGILTVDEEEALHHIKQQPEEALALYMVFVDGMKTHGFNAREWRSHTMALLPTKYWVGVETRCGMPLKYVAPNDLASLKYLTQTVANDAGLRQVRNREVLYNLLKDKVPSAIRQQYQKLLAWEPLSAEAVENYPNIGDSAVLGVMHGIEQMYYIAYTKQERKAREETRQDDPLKGTPPYLIEEIARRTSGLVQATIFQEAWGFEAEDFQSTSNFFQAFGGDVGDEKSLVLKVLLNVAANRMLLERAKGQALAQEGLKFNINLINALNARGIWEAPVVTDNNYSDEHIQEIMARWFSAGIPGFTLTEDYLEVCLELGKQAQTHYVKTRGANAPQTHESPYSRFLFTLALVACHYSGAQTTDEFSNGKWCDVVPGKSKGIRRTQPLPPGAQDMISSMYGQLFFGNYVHKLSPDGMATYAKAFQVKHAHLQHLLFLMFKTNSVSNIQAMYDMVHAWDVRSAA